MLLASHSLCSHHPLQVSRHPSNRVAINWVRLIFAFPLPAGSRDWNDHKCWKEKGTGERHPSERESARSFAPPLTLHQTPGRDPGQGQLYWFGVGMGKGPAEAPSMGPPGQIEKSSGSSGLQWVASTFLRCLRQNSASASAAAGSDPGLISQGRLAHATPGSRPPAGLAARVR